MNLSKCTFFQCLNKSCIETRGALSEYERETANYCSHIKQARQAQVSQTYAEHAVLGIENILSKVSDENLEDALKNESSDGEVHIFLLPGGNIAVPLLGIDKNQFMTNFVHIRGNVCTIDKCVKKVKSKLHTLVVKGQPVCRHSLLSKYKISPVKPYIQH